MRSVFVHLVGVSGEAVMTETEPEELEALRAALGQLPDYIVYANISGHIPGDTEARLFVTFLLQHFRGVAWDGYTSHCRTLAEIQAGNHALGHPFFDYKGWYREHTEN